MPPKVVELPDGSEIEFPEGMSANEIGAVLFNQSQPGQFLHRMFNPQVLEPYRQAAGELALDVMPVTGEQRSIDRLQQMKDSFKDKSTIGKVLTGADMALEGTGLAAGVIPGLKAAGAGVASLGSVIPLMARQGDNATGLAQLLKRQLGSVGSDDAAKFKKTFNADVYHGSTHDIKAFDASIANPESDWGKGIYTSNSIDDINPNYAGEGPDLTQRIQLNAERIASENDWSYDDPRALKLARKEIKGGSEGAVYPLKINTEKYANIGGDTPTYIEMPDYRAQAMDELDIADFADEFDYEDAVNEMADELMAWDYDSPLIQIRDELMRVAGDTDEAIVGTTVSEIAEEMYDGITAERLDEIIRSNITYIEDYDTGAALGGGAATSAVLKRLGYEGIIDNTVDVKFGSNRAMGQQMEGVYPDTQHIVTFEGFENNIRSVNAKFDPAKKGSKNILDARLLPIPAAGYLYSQSEDETN